VADSSQADEFRGTVAKLLEDMAAATRDARFSSAAAMVRGRRNGRRCRDDTKALDYAAALLAMKAATSPYKACEMAAVMFAPEHQVATMRDRLRRKFRTQIFKSED
jgi:hypothetical protein